MSKELLKGFDKFINRGLKEMNVPGVAVAVIKDGEVILAEGYGFADLEKKTKMTADHILPIGSSSKAFTATSVVMLAGEGKLDLDTPVREYMPEFQLSDPVATVQATPRDILCHRTGMPRHDLMWINWSSLERRDVVSKYLKHLPANKPFRSVWQYQNHMFASAGYLVEKITGQTWEDFVRERIFAPLKMKTATFRVKHPDKTGKYVTLYTENKQGKCEANVPLVIDGMGPAGSINATVREMANWVIFNLNKGKVGDKALVDEKVFPELQKPNIPYVLSPIVIPEKKIGGYSLGWFVDCYRGEKLVEHGGNVIGASALVSMLPEKNMGCVILTNAGGTQLTTAAAYDIYDRLLGVENGKNWVDFFVEATAPLKAAAKKQEKDFYDSKKKSKKMLHAAEEYLGIYSHPGYGDITVYKEKKSDALRLRYHDGDAALNHHHFDIFHFEMMQMPFPVSFKTSVKGEIESLSIQFEPQLPPSEFKKAEKIEQ